LKNSKGVVEGVPTLELVRKHALEQHLEMPITKTLFDLIFTSMSTEDAIHRLMSSTLEDEFPETFEDLLK
jgi:glycerol-3-phosphate dehydrogenase